MELERIAFRALLAFVFLHALLRVTGKYELTQARTIDFVLILILGDLIDDAICAEVPTGQFIVVAAALALTQIAISVAVYLSPMCDRIVCGGRVMIIRDGARMRRALRQLRMPDDELRSVMREQAIPPRHWDEVRSAWIEQDGQPSVLRHTWARPVPKADLSKLGR